MENNPKRNMYLLHVLSYYFFLSSESIVIAFRIVFHSISDFFRRKKLPIMLFYLFIFAVTVKCILTCGISLDSEKQSLSKSE
jgi:hypothetical protein